MEGDPKKVIQGEIEAKRAERSAGLLNFKTANRAALDASLRPNPKDLYHGLWYEGEVCCLFSDSNVGKSIYAVQMAEYIAFDQIVLYVDCELSDKQFQLRYTDDDSGALHRFPDTLYRAEIDPSRIDFKNLEKQIIQDIEKAAKLLDCHVIIIDNLTYLCNNSEKGDVAGLFMMSLINLKQLYGWSILVIAHTPKRNLTDPITQNHLAGSKKLINFFDSAFSIGKSARDENLRYVKQIKVRAGAFEYNAENVMVYELTKEGGYVHFEWKAYGSEREHLREVDESDKTFQVERAHEYKRQGKTVREIAGLMGISKSKADRLLKIDTMSQTDKNGTNGTSGTSGTTKAAVQTGDLWYNKLDNNEND